MSDEWAWLSEVGISRETVYKHVRTCISGHGGTAGYVNADDVFSDVLLKLWKVYSESPDILKTKFSEQPSLAFHLAHDALKKYKRYAARNAPLGFDVPASEKDGALPTKDECIAALLRLHPDSRIAEVFRLHLENWKGKDIAQHLRLHVGIVSTLKYKAEMLLKEHFVKTKSLP